eukprot:scaffold246560_cov19-Prasinocladus_malaysianus.AAC.1
MTLCFGVSTPATAHGSDGGLPCFCLLVQSLICRGIWGLQGLEMDHVRLIFKGRACEPTSFMDCEEDQRRRKMYAVYGTSGQADEAFK